MQSAATVKYFKIRSNVLIDQLGPEIEETGSASVRARSTFHSFGLAGKDSEEGQYPRMYTLKSLMKQNGQLLSQVWQKHQN